MLTLKIKTDNAAFHNNEEAAYLECARILREAADRLEQGYTTDTLQDYNGNTVGQFTLTKR